MNQTLQELEQSIYHATVSWLAMHDILYGGKRDMQSVLSAALEKGRLMESQRKVSDVDRHQLSHIFAGMIMDIELLDIRKVIADNRKSSNACHTHDYCDSNMVMLKAVSHVTGIPVDDIDILTDDFRSATNAAWDMAISRDFYYPEFVETRRFSPMLSKETSDQFDGPGLCYADGHGFIEIYIRNGNVTYSLLLGNGEWVSDDLGRLEQRLCSWCLNNNWTPKGR